LCVGKSGFKVFKFALRRCPNQAPPPWVTDKQKKTEEKEELNETKEGEDDKENRDGSHNPTPSSE
jgi:E3 ubiquitin-protein ligase UHRF1/protocadherin-15